MTTPFRGIKLRNHVKPNCKYYKDKKNVFTQETSNTIYAHHCNAILFSLALSP